MRKNWIRISNYGNSKIQFIKDYLGGKLPLFILYSKDGYAFMTRTDGLSETVLNIKLKTATHFIPLDAPPVPKHSAGILKPIRVDTFCFHDPYQKKDIWQYVSSFSNEESARDYISQPRQRFDKFKITNKATGEISILEARIRRGRV